MKKKLSVLFVAAMLCLALIIPALAADSSDYVSSDRSLELVADFADVLTSEQELLLIERLESLSAEYEMEIAVATVDSNEGKTPDDFAYDFYQRYGYGYGEDDDGLILVFNTGKEDFNRNVAISTVGRAINLFDGYTDGIIDVVISYLASAEYYFAFEAFATESEKRMDTSAPLYYIPLSVVIGIAIAFVIVKIQASSLKTVRQKVDAADYVGGLALTGEQDRFLFKNIRKTPKPKSNSSTRSSSGRSHGGSSKSF